MESQPRSEMSSPRSDVVSFCRDSGPPDALDSAPTQAVIDRPSGECKGYGFVRLSTMEEAIAAAAGMNNKDRGGPTSLSSAVLAWFPSAPPLSFGINSGVVVRICIVPSCAGGGLCYIHASASALSRPLPLGLAPLAHLASQLHPSLISHLRPLAVPFCSLAPPCLPLFRLPASPPLPNLPPPPLASPPLASHPQALQHLRCAGERAR